MKVKLFKDDNLFPIGFHNVQIAVINPMIELKTELKKHRGRRPVETYLGVTLGSISDHHNNETICIKGVTHFFGSSYVYPKDKYAILCLKNAHTLIKIFIAKKYWPSSADQGGGC